MNIDIRKEEFLELCEALEKGIITLEQFNKMVKRREERNRKGMFPWLKR